MMMVPVQMPGALFAPAVFLDAIGALAGYHDVFALTVPAGLGDFDLFALPAAYFAQTSVAAAVGTAAMMAGDARAAPGKHYAKCE
jgi:hypothetical protein